MPAQPAWFQRLDEAIAILESAPADASPWVDRRTVQTLLGVSVTGAWRILTAAGAESGPGRALVIDRHQFLEVLRRWRSSQTVTEEVERRGRVARRLTTIAEEWRSSRAIQLPARVREVRAATLPQGVTLEPGCLTVRFVTPQEFVTQLGSVLFALQQDWDAMRERIEPDPPMS